MQVKKAFCLFEQSGTFKNEFRKLGVEAEDYDILNDFGETDHVIDLFEEINRAYNGEPSLFDEIGQDDSARYRLQGNGIATPFWRWMLKRISAQYERTPTLGSLFDGQASFPMRWEGINGKRTALWSSEIEPHAVAVAKYHFPEEVNE